MKDTTKRDDVRKILMKVQAENDGILTTKDIEKNGLYRGVMKDFVEEGMLVRETKGIYYFADDCPDEYKLLQSRSEKMVFSYGTALYLWGLSDRVPHVIHVTVPQGYNVSRIKKDNPNVTFHYVQKDKWNVGLSEVETWSGSRVIVYNKERCICDLVLMKDEVDKQLYVQALKDYFKSGYDLRKLIEYARIFKIEEKIRDYMDVMA